MVIPLRYGNTNTFLIKGGKGSVLVDTDYAGTMPAFYKTIKAKGVKVSDITYVLATHYHPDHIGLVSELMDQGIKLMLMESQTGSVHFSDGIFENESRIDYKPIDEKVALILRFEESRSFFEGLGIEGEIIATPSHSEDSISVILDNGDCFVGDLEPVEYLSAYDNNTALEQDWHSIMSRQPRRIFYAHANEKIL
jgi:glyoxylase-like metal-dependent hydrolase (beta-lactamase superfamily II)